MALILKRVASGSPLYVTVQSNSSVRTRNLVQLEPASSFRITSQRLAHCSLWSANSWNRRRSLRGNFHQKLNWNGKFSGSGTQQFWGKIDYVSRQPNGGVVLASLAAPATVEVAANLFQLATAFVVPFYTLMILAPKWEWTQKLMESELTYLLLGAGYVYLLCVSWTPKTLGLMFSSKYWLPELPGITQMFSSSLTVASAWLHLLAADLYAGRQVFLDGAKHNVETRHSLILCLMMCPIGIFSHLLTKSLVLSLRRAWNLEKVDICK